MKRNAGVWGMRGPQNKLHFYPGSGNKAICGTSSESFLYSETERPDPKNCCGRCLRSHRGTI